LQPGAVLVQVIDADSWNDAMGQYHAIQGWEPYKPMLDENGNPYPEDSLPHSA